MNVIRGHWYTIGLAVAIATGIFLAFSWNDLSVLQRLLILSFVAVLIHQFEEYGFPGGFPAIMNMVLRPSPHPDRYPLNQNNAMITNVVASYGFYLTPAFFPTIIWLGLAPMIAGVAQFAIHRVQVNVKLKTVYNPGLGAVVFLHIPIAAYYIYYIYATNIASVWDWVIGTAYAALFAFVVVNKMNLSLLADKNSPYVFADEEMRRFNVQEKLDRLLRP